MTTQRRNWCHKGVRTLSGLLFAMALLYSSGRQAVAQPFPGMVMPERTEPGVNHILRLPRDPLAQTALVKARQTIEAGNVAEGLEALQQMLDSGSDFFIPKGVTVTESHLDQIESLILSSAAEYQRLYGSAAQQMFDESQRNQDQLLLEELIRRFRLTEAGAKGLREFSRIVRDRGEPVYAARLLELLAEHPAANDRQQLLREAAELLLRAGQPQRAAALLSRHATAFPDGAPNVDALTVPNRDAKIPSAAEGTLYEWRTPYGGLQQTGQVGFAPAIYDDAWSSPLVLEYDFDALFPNTKLIDQLVKDNRELANGIEKKVRSRKNRAVFPAGRPLIVNDLLITVGGGSVKALNLHTGKLQWNGVIVDQTFSFLSKGSYSPSDAKDPVREEIRNLFTAIRDWRDLTSSSLSTDGKQVYAITDCALVGATTPQRIMQSSTRNMLLPQRSNRLHAFDLATDGMLRWSIGTNSTEGSMLDVMGEAPREIFFLGPPLPVDGRLFVMGEERGQIQLIELDPATGSLLWSVGLLNPQGDLLQDSGRRLAGLMPAYADGLLICPTGEGVITAVDPLRRKMVWSQPYVHREKSDTQRMMVMQMLRSTNDSIDESVEELLDDQRWMDARLIVAGTYVIATPPDENLLVCLNVEDGQPVWTQHLPRLQMLYAPCVADDRLIVVGRGEVQALRLSDGQPVWPVPVQIPLPSGRGVRMGNQFLQPLDTGEIGLIDLSAGRLLSRIPVTSGGVPGNLVAANGTLVSQSGAHISAFRSQAAVMAELTRLLEANPDHAEALSLRGELAVQRGDLAGGLPDLRRAVAAGSQTRAERVLSWALLEGLRTDFATYRESISELEQLPLDPEQRLQFLLSSAKGLQDSGERNSALLAYLNVLEILGDAQTLRNRDNSWATSDSRWVLARIEELFQAAPDDERLSLRQSMDSWVKGTASDELVLRLLPSIPQSWVAPEAVLERMELIPSGNRLNLQREAILTALARSEELAISLRSKLLLATLSAHLKDADELDRILLELEAADPSTELEPGRTLADALQPIRENSLATALRKTVLRWPPHAHVTEDRPFESSNTSYQLPLFGPVSPQLKGWTFFIEQMGGKIDIVDAHGVHRAQVPTGQANSRYAGMSQGRYVSVSNHLALIVLMDHFVIVNLLTESGDPSRIATRSLDSGEDRIYGSRSFIAQQMIPGLRTMRGGVPGGPQYGNVGPLTQSLLCYTHRDQLIAIDPLSGRELWTRRNIPTGSEILGDEHVVIVKTPDSNELQLFRGSDGKSLGISTLPAGVIVSFERSGGDWGRFTPVVRRDQNGFEWSLVDLTSNEVHWKQTASTGTIWSCVNGQQVAFLTPERELSVFDPLSKTEILRVEVPETGGARQFTLLEYPEQWILATSSRDTDRRRFELQRLREFSQCPVDGVLVAIDRSTRQLAWSQSLKDFRLVSDPPGAWPVLVLTSLRSRTLNLLLLNRHTGAEIYRVAALDQESGMSWWGEVSPFRILFRIGRESLSLNFDFTPETGPRPQNGLPPQAEPGIEPTLPREPQ
ncbi:outer membrane protein assembly factor BamB family protein [Planctomicrobium sp. SH664]|uniref:outer membrane protein assembly factor BamB family protein n=1 Tax=Planctomicrobium sp. SH664 TaxID=3448125 RepID=UPI003F5C21E8